MPSNEKVLRITLRLQDEASKELNKAADGVKKLGDNLTSMGQKMTVGITAPIAGLGVLAAKTAIDFESAFAGVAKTVGGTAAELETLRNELEMLATSAESPVSSLENAHMELFGIAEAAGQLGVAREDIIAFTDVMGQLAMSTDLAGEEGAAMIARFANVADMPLSEIRQFGDAITTLGNNSAATEKDILAMSLRLASIADLGFNTDEILGYSTALSSLGIGAELGGTNFMKGMNEIARAVALGGEELANFAEVAGMTSAQFSRAWKDDASGALQAFLNGLGEMSADQRILALEKLGLTGSEMQRVFLSLAGSTEMLTDTLNASSAAFAGNGALMEEASRFAETTAGRINRAKNMFNQVMADFGEQLLPLIVDFLEKGVIPLLTWLNSLSDTQRQWIIGILAAVAAIGPLLVIVGQLMGAFTAIQAFMVAFPAIAAAFGTGLSLMLGPIGLIILALGALFLAYQTNFLGIKTLIDGFVNFFIEAFNILFRGDYVGKFLSEDHPFIGFLFKIREAIKPALDAIGTLVSGLTNAWGQMISQAGTALGQLATMIATAWGKMGTMAYEFGTSIINGLINGIKSKAVDLIAYVFGLSKEMTAAIKRALGIASPSKVMMKLGEQTAAGFHKGIEGFGGIGVNVNGRPVNGSAPTLAAAGAGGDRGGGNIYIENLIMPPGTTKQQVDAFNKEVARQAKIRGAKK